MRNKAKQAMEEASKQHHSMDSAFIPTFMFFP